VSGSKATLLPPRPLRTRRASFPAARSSLSNALVGTRLDAFTIRAWSRRTFCAGGCTNGIFRRHLLFPLSRFARFSREERPEGSLPAFAWSNFAEGSTPIHSITEWHSLFPSSSTRTAIDSPYGLSSQWERYGFIVFRLSAKVGKVLSIRRRSFVHDREGLSPCADRAPFWSKPVSIFGLS
jgi:hypothetical protein